MDYDFAEMISLSISSSPVPIETDASSPVAGCLWLSCMHPRWMARFLAYKLPRVEDVLYTLEFLMHKNLVAKSGESFQSLVSFLMCVAGDGMCFFVVRRDVFQRSVVNPQYVWH